jgi:hypothetical protein
VVDGPVAAGAGRVAAGAAFAGAEPVEQAPSAAAISTTAATSRIAERDRL